MHDRIRGLRPAVALVACALAMVALAACGASGGSGDAQSLLKQTFGGAHKVNSGNLAFTVTVDPTGSSTITGPVVLSFGGPFQSLGTGKLPKSNFQISVSEQGKKGSIGILSTGKNGYVTLSGTSYRLPAASFHKLESSFASVSGSSGGKSAGLGGLGIDPLKWLENPSIVGQEDVGGTSTTHIRATIDVRALLADLNTFLQSKASSLGGKVPSRISPATVDRISGAVSSPRFDVWTGDGDKTVRKLQLQLTLPVSGQIATLLGGLHSAQIGLTMAYAGLNQPQTISAPTDVRPYSEFTAKLQSFVAAVQSLTSGASGAGTSRSTTTPSTGAGTTSGAAASGGAATARASPPRGPTSRRCSSAPHCWASKTGGTQSSSSGSSSSSASSASMSSSWSMRALGWCWTWKRSSNSSRRCSSTGVSSLIRTQSAPS